MNHTQLILKMDTSQEEIYKQARKALQLNSCNPLDWNGPSANEVRLGLELGNKLIETQVM